ncbi:MAG: Ig-like domain-containing protein, partial [Patescibacteria group bacterium]
NGQPVTPGTPIKVTNGTVVVNPDGTVTVTPDNGFTGDIKFDYTVTTPEGTKVSAKDTVTIYSATNDDNSTSMNTPVTYNPLDNDKVPAGSKIVSINGQPATLGSSIKVTNGTVLVNADGTVTVTPDQGYYGTITFPYEVLTPDGVKVAAVDTIVIPAPAPKPIIPLPTPRTGGEVALATIFAILMLIAGLSIRKRIR